MKTGRMKEIEIQKDIPVPGTINSPIKYPFEKMEIGDSFFIPNVGKKFSITSVVRHFNYTRQKNIKVTQRREDNGIRIWRIA